MVLRLPLVAQSRSSVASYRPFVESGIVSKSHTPRLAIELENGSVRLLDPADLYWVEAEREDSWIRTRSSKRLKDRRRLGRLVELWSPWGVIRIHRSHAVQISRVIEIRPRSKGDGWEVKLASPVNRVLAVGEEYREGLWEALGLG